VLASRAAIIHSQADKDFESTVNTARLGLLT